MKYALNAFLFASLLLACAPAYAKGSGGLASANQHAKDHSAAKGAPADVVLYKKRKEGCAYYGSMAPSDAKKMAQIRKGMADYKCNGLTRDGDALKDKYKKSPNILKTLGE